MKTYKQLTNGQRFLIHANYCGDYHGVAPKSVFMPLKFQLGKATRCCSTHTTARLLHWAAWRSEAWHL